MTKELFNRFFPYVKNDHVLDFVCEYPDFGRMHSDDDEDPSYLFLSIGHYLFVSENIDEKIVKTAICKLFPLNVKSMLQTILVFYPNKKIRDIFERLYDRQITFHKRKVFIFSSGMKLKTPVSGDSTKKITPKLMVQDLTNVEMVRDEIVSTNSYFGMEDFYERGIGYMTIDSDAITGFCVSEYQSEHKLGVGIHVNERYRNQRLASMMTQSFLTEANAKRMNVYWDCWSENEPSVKTAQTNGFLLKGEYPVMVMRLLK